MLFNWEQIVWCEKYFLFDVLSAIYKKYLWQQFSLARPSKFDISASVWVLDDQSDVIASEVHSTTVSSTLMICRCLVGCIEIINIPLFMETSIGKKNFDNANWVTRA